MGTETETDSIRDSSRTGPYLRFIRWLETLSDAQYAYVLLSPALLLLGVVAIWPLLSTFEMSLRADALVGAASIGEFVWFENYVRLLTNNTPGLPADFFPFVGGTAIVESALGITLVFGAVSVLFETLLGFAQALVLDQDFRGRRWVRVAIIIPWAVPIVIQGMIFFLMFQPNIGFLLGSNQDPAFLQQIGVFTATPLRNTVDTLIIIMVADIWKTSAFMALLILAGLQSIDRSLYDVAKVAGASNWQQFKMITFPLILPSVVVAMLFRTIGALRVFGIIETVSSCSTVPSLSCLVVQAFSSRL